MNNYRTVTIICIIILIYLNTAIAYKMENGSEVHQHITNESQNVWKLIPIEIKEHLKNSIKTNINTLTARNVDFNPGEDIINGSAEEDIRSRPLQHFWNPDTPQNGNYNDGLNSPWNRQSSYRTALGYWTNNIIPAYLRGDINESYYWLGRVAHLLEDAAQPGHVLLDCHPDEPILELLCDQSQIENPDDSVLEEYTGDNFQTLRITYNWTGSNFAGQQYNYENLPNLSNFNWKEVEPNSPLDRQNIELFRLFWHTAQKTQYFASDDVDGNSVYVNLSGSTKNFSIPLWDGENLRVINRSIYLATDDLTDSGANVSAEANAMLPHSMKAVAGLYRLFWDAVHIDWPTENHDYRRTGLTLLKGDLINTSVLKNEVNLVLEGEQLDSDAVVKASVADIDGNGFMDSIIVTHKKTLNTFSRLYGIETRKIKLPYIERPFYPTRQKWSVQNVSGGAIWFPPTIVDVDDDGKKEIFTGVRNGTIYAYNYTGSQLKERWRYHLVQKFSSLAGENITRFNGAVIVEDIDLDGKKEIIFADVSSSDGDEGWSGDLYVLGDDGGSPTLEYNITVGHGGAYASISAANLDSDDNPEIVVPTRFGIFVYDFNSSTNQLQTKCSNNHMVIESSAVISDIDLDNDYDLAYVTSSRFCDAGHTCGNITYVLDAQTCNINLNKQNNILTRPTPAVANLDSDSNQEIIISGVNRLAAPILEQLGSIKAIDSISGNADWTYDDGGTLKPGFISPNVADVDNDGKLNVVVGQNNGSTVHVIKNDGTQLYKFEVSGFMDNGLAIADIDNDNSAEIVFKRAGSPTLFASLSNQNFPPELNAISNITAIAGNLININASSEVSAIDLEGNNVQFFYSSPFNSSGLWQTTVNDTGNYSILVEASDGNLSNYKFVDVIVFNETTKLINNFSDNSTQKILNFTQAGNLTVNIRLPKNATVIYSKIKIKGTAP